MQRYSGFGLFKHSLSHHENWQRMWRTPTPKKVYDVVIVGGGGHGLATAYYLAKEGSAAALLWRAPGSSEGVRTVRDRDVGPTWAFIRDATTVRIAAPTVSPKSSRSRMLASPAVSAGQYRAGTNISGGTGWRR